MTYKVEIDDSTQYATVYNVHGRPAATIQRRRILAPKSEPLWKVYDLDGVQIGQLRFTSDPEMVAKLVGNMLRKQLRNMRHKQACNKPKVEVHMGKAIRKELPDA